LVTACAMMHAPSERVVISSNAIKNAHTIAVSHQLP
jgi:hypothetical protein